MPELDDDEQRSSRDRVQFLTDAIERAINYNRLENRVSYAEIIGVLEIKKAEMINEALGVRTRGDED